MNSTSKREGITPKQKKKIWASAHAAGMSEVHLRDIVEGISGDYSISALTKREAKKVIEVLEGKGCLPVPRNNPNVIALATPGQLSLIEKLKEESAWTDEHLMNFILKKFKRDNLRKLRRAEAGVVIEVLNKAIRKKREVT